MTEPTRRGLLRNLATLPLIGGSVALIGMSTAAAVPVNDAMLDAYSQWLFFERRLLCMERYGAAKQEALIPMNTAADQFHVPCLPSVWSSLPQPSTRAAIVLSAVGCPLTEGDS